MFSLAEEGKSDNWRMLAVEVLARRFHFHPLGLS
jgi:hypothetical protein